MPEANPAPSTVNGAWTKLSLLVTTLNPILLLVIGYILNGDIERTKAQVEATKIKIEENSAKLLDLKTTAETATIAVHDRVDKVKVISDFLNDLSGPDERRRGLAIEAIFIALPDEAARLVKVVERNAEKRGETTQGNDAAVARDALAATRDRLVADLFSTDRTTRRSTLATLERGWTNDAPIVDQLVARAMVDVSARETAKWAKPPDERDKSFQQLASIYNTAEVLSYTRAQLDAAQMSRVAAFLDRATPNSDDTRQVVATIKDRFH